MDNFSLGKRLKEARTKRKLTQEQLAELADISTIFLGEIERGEKLPSITVFIRLVQSLDVSADSLLRDDLPSGKSCVNNEVTSMLDKLTPKQRATAVEILEAYIRSL